MHDIEPFYNWRDEYVAAEDKESPFYGERYDEFYFTKKIYNYFIHPQWDSFDSTTMFIKVLYVDYEKGYAIFELIGEWNDCIHNDIMILKRNILEYLMDLGVSKFIIIAENVLNFHPSDDLYYEEFYEEMREEDGWAVMLNLHDHVEREMRNEKIHYYINMGGILNHLNWRAMKPQHLYGKIELILDESPELLN